VFCPGGVGGGRGQGAKRQCKMHDEQCAMAADGRFHDACFEFLKFAGFLLGFAGGGRLESS
jgi:hypothetical protein